MAGPLDSLLTQADSANPAVFAGGVPNLQAPKPAPATAVTTPGAVGGYGPAATGVYVPPGGTRALNIQSGQPVDLKTGAATPVMPSGPGGTFANAQERRAWYMQEATARGIPTELVDRLVNSEGGWATFDTRQDSGTSFGPLAMHVAGTVPGTTASGLGDEFRKQTGLNPADPKNEMALARFGLDYIKANGASPDVWHGLRNVPGISLADRAAAVAKVQNDKYAEAAGLNKTADAAIKAVGEMRGDQAKMWERIREAQGKADQANDAAKEAISKAPPQPDINGFKQLNGLAVLVGVLGGLFTKSPMRSSINAAAAAIEAYNDHDREAYETSYKNWQTQTNMLSKISDTTQNRVKDILYAENMGFNERNALLDTTLRAAGLTDLANRRKTEGDEILLKWREDTAAARAKQRELEQKEKDNHEWRMFQVSNPRNEMEWINQRINEEDKENVAQGLPPYTSAEKIERGEAIKKAMNEGRRAASSTPRPITATMPDKTTWSGEATYDTSKGTYTGIGRSEPFPEGTTFKPAPASVGVNAANINQRILMGATDLDLQLKNWTALPMGTTLGLFSGAQAQSPEGLTDALRKNLANAATPEAAQYASVLRNGLSRSLGMLMSGGAAQGLVTFSKQLEGDIPQENDTTGTILFKIADMKQIGRNAIEVVKTNPLIGEEQKKLLDKIDASLESSAPFTPTQVIRMTHGDEQSMREFVKTLPELNGGAGEKPPPAGAVGQRKNPDGTTSYQMPDGEVITQ